MHALVTGGAGFIGAHVVERLIADGHDVRVLDDLSSGRKEDVPDGVELIVGDIADPETAQRATAGVEVVFHQAALRAVLRSVENPLATERANAHGTLNVLEASRINGVRRVVSASSSSVYGGGGLEPMSEMLPLNPRSPYAVSKLAGEQYARVFAELFGLETVSLRYFNVYGPRQRPDSAYAAVIPLFIDALRNGRPPLVHGDGQQSRDFTFVSDVVAANLAAASAPAAMCSGKAYNVSFGASHSLLDLLDMLGDILGVTLDPEFGDPRPGDVRHTHADVTAARTDLGYAPEIAFREGLERTVAWFAAT
jgi:UDP-glucose 4-epimerase